MCHCVEHYSAHWVPTNNLIPSEDSLTNKSYLWQRSLVVVVALITSPETFHTMASQLGNNMKIRSKLQWLSNLFTWGSPPRQHNHLPLLWGMFFPSFFQKSGQSWICSCWKMCLHIPAISPQYFLWILKNNIHICGVYYYFYFQCEYLQVSPQVTLASRHLILWNTPSPHWPPPPHWPRSSEARTQCPAPSRRGTRIKLSTKFSDSFDIILRRPLLWPSPFNRFNRFIHSY